MKKYILLIRHGKTKGNIEGRYIGKNTDESLCEQGRAELLRVKEKYLPLLKDNAVIYSGSMKRALETAEILFPNHQIIVNENLTEIDFGAFENKNYSELNGNPDYQRWIDSNGRADYPGGERLLDFISRSEKSFRDILHDMKEKDFDRAAVVCHGGNIMAIMSSLTGKDYFDFQIENAKGFWLELEVKDKEIDLLSFNRL